MRKIWLVLLLLVACGDPISGASNCTELLQATVAAGEELPDGTFTGLTGEARTAAIEDFDEQWSSLRERVEAKANPMMAAAIERGAEMEALLCVEATSEARGPIAQVFERVAGELGATTTSP